MFSKLSLNNAPLISKTLRSARLKPKVQISESILHSVYFAPKAPKLVKKYSPTGFFTETKTTAFTVFNAKPFHRDFSTGTVTKSLPLTYEFDSNNNLNFKLPVPLSKETILFSVRSNQTVREFLADLKDEDPAIQNVTIYSDGHRISASNRMEDIMRTPFELNIDGKKYSVNPSSAQSTFASPSSSSSGSSNAAHHHNKNQKNLSSTSTTVDTLDPENTDPIVRKYEEEIIPLLQQKKSLDHKAYRYADLVLFGGLGAFVAQWAFLARLTWWEFNWDIMEPVTYFITSGTAVLGYIYFVMSKQEYTFPNLRDALAAKRMYRNYVKSGFDIDKYFSLEHKLKKIDPDAMARIESHLEDHEHYQRDLVMKSESDRHHQASEAARSHSH